MPLHYFGLYYFELSCMVWNKWFVNYVIVRLSLFLLWCIYLNKLLWYCNDSVMWSCLEIVTPRVLALHNLTCITWAWSSRIHKQAFTIETFDWNSCNICLLSHVSLSYATFLVISCLHVYMQMIMNENMYLVVVSHKNM